MNRFKKGLTAIALTAATAGATITSLPTAARAANAPVDSCAISLNVGGSISKADGTVILGQMSADGKRPIEDGSLHVNFRNHDYGTNAVTTGYSINGQEFVLNIPEADTNLILKEVGVSNHDACAAPSGTFLVGQNDNLDASNFPSGAKTDHVFGKITVTPFLPHS